MSKIDKILSEIEKDLSVEESEDEKLLQPRDARMGMMLGDWKIVGVTSKTVTITMPDARSPRFAGRKFRYKWDGTGFKAGPKGYTSYLTLNGIQRNY